MRAERWLVFVAWEHPRILKAYLNEVGYDIGSARVVGNSSGGVSHSISRGIRPAIVHVHGAIQNLPLAKIVVISM